MATYAELAPIISGTGITRNQVETYFENLPDPPDPPTPPTITSSKVVDLANIYFEASGVEKRGGLRQVAIEVGLWVSQCKAIIDEIKVLKVVWDQMQLENPITAFADAGGGYVTVTSAGHEIVENQTVVISETTNYNDTYTAVNVTTDTFDILATWVSDDATGIVTRIE